MTVPTLPLTARQSEVLRFIREYIAETGGIPPSRRDICAAMGIAPNAVQGMLLRLAKLGAIEIVPGIARGIRVVERKHG